MSSGIRIIYFPPHLLQDQSRSVSPLDIMYETQHSKCYRLCLPSPSKKNLLPWIRFLLDNGVRTADSMALLRAVKSKANVSVIQLLLNAAQSRGYLAQGNYGSAALRRAVLDRDPEMVGILCKSVDRNAIELSTEEALAKDTRKAVSPLGQAIIMKNDHMVETLLRYGASPNAYVSTRGLELWEQNRSRISRVTSLLAAVDLQSFIIIKILVEKGGEISYKRQLGIFQTPLQRAAEVGNFEITEYLVSLGAEIDTTPAFSSGTALQLAAMNGYCGIVRFLLDQGADPNYPPSQGHGRTAFEAAAEWARFDVMSLLIQRGVQLDFLVGAPLESQYDRAKRFAEENGCMASKRHVENLYKNHCNHADLQVLNQMPSPVPMVSPTLFFSSLME